MEGAVWETCNIDFCAINDGSQIIDGESFLALNFKVSQGHPNS